MAIALGGVVPRDCHGVKLWPLLETLVCHSRGLEGAEKSSSLLSNMKRPGFAYLQVLSPTGEDIVDPRVTNVAKVIEDRRAAFNRMHEGFMVIACRKLNNEIGLYIMYDHNA